ncbi:MAG: fimbrillin family protein [Bacteroidia bacterium]|nr:fimbrillin family protein [Bacteroidia bacterium]
MKKYLFTILAVTLAFVGCTKINLADSASNEDQEINFETALYTGRTKADLDHDGHSALTGSFIVRGFFTGDKAWANVTDFSSSSTDAVVYMDAVEISKQKEGDNDVWKATSGKYYWPKAGQLSFIGYTGWTADPTWGSEKATLLSFTETIGDNYDKDPMVSDAAVNYSQNPTTATHFVPGVPMLFHHATAQVAFKALEDTEVGDGEGLDYEILLKNVTIKNLVKTGTYTANYAANDATVSGAWTATTDKGDRVIYNDATGLKLTTTAQSVYDAKAVLPQALVDAATTPATDVVTALVSYTINVYKEGTTSPVMATKTYTNIAVSLVTEKNITAWNQNTIYTYTIKIAPVSGEIHFDPAVVDWSQVDAGTIDVD